MQSPIDNVEYFLKTIDFSYQVLSALCYQYLLYVSYQPSVWFEREGLPEDAAATCRIFSLYCFTNASIFLFAFSDWPIRAPADAFRETSKPSTKADWFVTDACYHYTCALCMHDILDKQTAGNSTKDLLLYFLELLFLRRTRWTSGFHAFHLCLERQSCGLQIFCFPSLPNVHRILSRLLASSSTYSLTYDLY